MKYFKYWVEEPFNIIVDGKSERIEILSGSNISSQDASEQAKTRSKQIEDRIQHGGP